MSRFLIADAVSSFHGVRLPGMVPLFLEDDGTKSGCVLVGPYVNERKHPDWDIHLGLYHLDYNFYGGRDRIGRSPDPEYQGGFQSPTLQDVLISFFRDHYGLE